MSSGLGVCRVAGQKLGVGGGEIHARAEWL